MFSPFGTKLDLFVLLTIGKAYEGDEEHFSTVCRLTGPKEGLVTGEYVVPVTAHFGCFKNTAELATAKDGGNNSSDLELATMEKGRGVNRINKCKNVIGDRCQTRITIVADNKQATFLPRLHENMCVPVERRTEYTEIPPCSSSSRITCRSACSPQTGCTCNAATKCNIGARGVELKPRAAAKERGRSSPVLLSKCCYGDDFPRPAVSERFIALHRPVFE
jgi:hypothetical protein